MTARTDPDTRFDGFLSPPDADGHVIWRGGEWKGFSLGRKLVQAHRYLWERTRGEIPQGLVLMQTCDKPGCVSPEHHEVVTLAETRRRNRKGIRRRP